MVYDVDEDEGTVTLTVSIQEGSIQEGETRVVTLTTMDDSALCKLVLTALASVRIDTTFNGLAVFVLHSPPNFVELDSFSI